MALRLCRVLVSLLLATPALAADKSVEVAEFFPRGTVKEVRQVTARFSATMVPIGDPRPADGGPLSVDCAGVPPPTPATPGPTPSVVRLGAGRWVDSRTWVYDFDRDLPAGVRCSFHLRDGVTSLSGAPVGGERDFGFDTGGPSVRASIPYAGNESIEEEQAFVLSVDAEPTETSMLTHVWFTVEGLPEKIGVRAVTGSERAAILASLDDWEVGEGPTVIVQARQRFPSNAAVKLVWGKGVETASGLATAEDQVFEFNTRAPFAAYLRCEKQNENAGCVPFLPIAVTFTAPVEWKAARQAVLIGPDGKRWSPEPPSEPDPYVSRAEFKGPFPEKAELRLELPDRLTDDAGRPLVNDEEYPLRVQTAEDPPLAKFTSRFGILEEADPVLPVTLRNLEPIVQGREDRVTRERPAGFAAQVDRLVGSVMGRSEKIAAPEDVLPWLRKVGSARRTKSVFADLPPPHPAVPGEAPSGPSSFELPKPNGARAFEVVGIPLASPGLYIVELSSKKLGQALLGNDVPMYVATAALVTNLAVHFKWGRDNSLAWVTRLEDAAPVAKAHVAVQDCSGKILWQGETNDEGYVFIAGLPERDQVQRCLSDDSSDENDPNPDYYDDFSDAEAINPYALNEGVLVTAQVPGDISFVHSSWMDGIQPWRFQLPADSTGSDIAAHTVFDRTLLRAGETVHMKHVVRAETMEGFGFLPPEKRPGTVEILHLGSSDKFELPLAWDAAGNAETTWQIPKQAKLGSYDVVLRGSSSEPWRDRWRSGSFRVEEFRLPLMRGTLQLPAEPQVQTRQVPVQISVQYLAGGGASSLPVRLRAQIRSRAFTPPLQFEHFTFGNGGLTEGRSQETDDESEPEPKPDAGIHQREDLELDAAGTAQAEIRDIPPSSALRELLAELEYRDPNGQLQTVASTVPLWPAQWMVGIEPSEWIGSDKKIEAKLAVVDPSGRPVSGAPVKVEVRRHERYSFRKRIVGGFYAYEHIDQIGPVIGTLCEGITDGRGLFVCEGTAPAEGELALAASVKDAEGRESLAHADVYVHGNDRMWFRVEDSDRIDVLPEKIEYAAGETARFQVRSPFGEATALVTSEREGILDARVVHISGKEPVIELPVTAAYSPNVFVSVFLVRGRIAAAPPTAMVDLGKPAFKLGIAEIKVGWQPHELKVEVSSDREVYRVRDKAQVKVRVRTHDGRVPPPGGEIALAAVDEGLLELQPNTSWNLLARMMGRRGYWVQTATAQMQVVGKRHFGLKARPQGGGGGRQTTRELFDTLLLWKGRIELDANGEASAEVPINDSLTSFRLAAIATDGAGLFGNGGASIRTTQDLMLLSGLPPLVREGDVFSAQFTLRNTTDKPMEVRVSAAVEGLKQPLPEQTKALAAGESSIVSWDVTVPVGVEALRYVVSAANGGASDRLAVTQQVKPAVPVRTFQATVMRLDKPITEKVALPAGAVPGRGGVDVNLAASLAVGLDGVREYMEAYPFTCLEQRISRAISLGDERMWQDISQSLPTYLDNDGLLKFFPRMDEGSDVLTAYVLSLSITAGRLLPPDVQQRMEEALARFVDGSLARKAGFEATDLSIRKLAAVAALARAGKATAAMLGSVAIEPNLWPTSAVLDWWTILRRVPSAGAAKQREAEQIVRSRLNLQGTTLGFSAENRENHPWLMSCADGTAAQVLLQALEAGVWRDDVPRLVRGLLLRQERGHWDCTTSNAWGTVAVHAFTKAFEATPVGGITSATLGGETKSLTWTQPPQPATFDFAWPNGAGDLAVRHEGTGTPWMSIQARAAVPLAAPLSSGYRITKTIEAVEARQAGRYSVGDVLRIRLAVEAQADMTWVVIDDPIPAGASHLGTGLARDSQIATAGENHEDLNQPAFVERGFAAYRAYYQTVPKGPLTTEYTIRLNQSGHLSLPTTRVEALYAPEMFGELPNAAIDVEP